MKEYEVELAYTVRYIACVTVIAENAAKARDKAYRAVGNNDFEHDYESPLEVTGVTELGEIDDA